MVELRILSGLHRGATLPLDERALIIGADDDADVVLVDPGIEMQHATLALTGQGWSLTTLDGAVLGHEHNRPLASLDLRAGDIARLGHVWLTVVDADAPWKNPPPEPTDDGADDGADNAGDDAIDAADDTDREPSLYPDDGAEENELYSDSPLDAAPDAQAEAAQKEAEAAQAAATQAAAQAKTARPAASKPARRGGWRRSKMVLIPIGLATILSACAAYTMTSRSDESSSTPKPRAAASLAALPAAPKPAAQTPPPSPALAATDLRAAFRQRLKEVDLLKRVNLDLKDKEWTMQASLDTEEAARFERILKTFIETHRITFPVHAKVGSQEAMLPFRIREVVSGSNASVVTQDGNRLYIGDVYRGARLVAIERHHLQFDGERKIKVSW